MYRYLQAPPRLHQAYMQQCCKGRPCVTREGMQDVILPPHGPHAGTVMKGWQEPQAEYTAVSFGRLWCRRSWKLSKAPSRSSSSVPRACRPR